MSEDGRIHDGFGGLIAYDLVPPQKILLPCINCTHPEGYHVYEDDDESDLTIAEVAEDAIQTLADVLDDIRGGVKDFSGHEEQLAYLRQALIETREFQLKEALG